MNKSTVVRFGLVPALVLALLTALRAWLEVTQPDAMTTRLVSVMLLGAIWVLVSAIMLLRAGASFGRYLGAMTVFVAIFRSAIAAAYTLAWMNRWRTSDGRPTRYEVQTDQMVEDLVARMGLSADPSPWVIWSLNAVFPIVIHVLFAIVVWFAVWAVAFRTRRPAARGAASPGAGTVAT